MYNLNIAYITCCENGFFGLEHLVKQNIRPSQVITIHSELGSAYNVSGFKSPVDFCNHHNIPIKELDCYNVTRKDFFIQPDLIIVNGWNRLLSKDVITYAKNCAIGVHAGHPPIGHGRAPLPWNLIKGMKDIEVYIFKLTEHADDGNIINLQTVEITETDTIKLLYEKVMYITALLIEKSIVDIKNDSVIEKKQCLDYAINYPKRTPSHGKINFSLSANEIYNFVRAQSKPYPGAFSYLSSHKCTLWEITLFDSFSFRNESRVPGKIIAALPSGIVVMTGTSPIWLLNVECKTLNNTIFEYPSSEALIGRVFGDK